MNMALRASGIRASLGDTYERSRPRLRALASRFVDRQDAEDVLHDAFVLALQYAGSFRNDAAPTTWLHRIVVNACITDCRRRARRCLVDIASTADDPNLVTRPDQHKVVLVRNALKSLSRDDRRLCVLHYVIGYSHAEIASALGIPIGTSKSQLHAARHRLRRLMTAPMPQRSARRVANGVTERSNAATEERLKSGHAVGGPSIV
jgi:RNA polymerase sigma-70 factor (ECF subfamily)